ncbi:hypothetical protein BH10PLA2_BH10PLA2_03940 [soil metagenome]
MLASLCQIWRKALSLGVLTGSIVLLSTLDPSTERVQGADHGTAPALYTVCDLKQMNTCQLEALFASSSPGQMPSGWVPGELLILTDFPMPRLSESLARRYWQGKHIEPDGSFINQFKYKQRFPSKAVIGPSLYDEKPAIVMAYPSGTPVFGNIRDEFREVSPGLYLGRIYSTAKCPRFLGFMYLRQAGCCR